MTRLDWLVLFFGLKGSPQGLDPIRIQKGMFLFAMEGDVAEAERYEFRPYNYGPMSAQVYADVEALEAQGLIAASSVVGYSWKRYRPTDRGLERAREIRDEARVPDAVHRLFEIKQSVVSKDFDALLRDVYARYPAYAARSVFQA